MTIEKFKELNTRAMREMFIEKGGEFAPMLSVLAEGDKIIPVVLPGRLLDNKDFLAEVVLPKLLATMRKNGEKLRSVCFASDAYLTKYEAPENSKDLSISELVRIQEKAAKGVRQEALMLAYHSFDGSEGVYHPYTRDKGKIKFEEEAAVALGELDPRSRFANLLDPDHIIKREEDWYCENCKQSYKPNANIHLLRVWMKAHKNCKK